MESCLRSSPRKTSAVIGLRLAHLRLHQRGGRADPSTRPGPALIGGAPQGAGAGLHTAPCSLAARDVFRHSHGVDRGGAAGYGSACLPTPRSSATIPTSAARRDQRHRRSHAGDGYQFVSAPSHRRHRCAIASFARLDHVLETESGGVLRRAIPKPAGGWRLAGPGSQPPLQPLLAGSAALSGSPCPPRSRRR